MAYNYYVIKLTHIVQVGLYASPAIIWLLPLWIYSICFVTLTLIIHKQKMQQFKQWMVTMTTTIFTSSSKEGVFEHANTDQYFTSLSPSAVLFPNCSRECPSADLVSRWGPSCRGNSHLCILADWPLVSHSRERPSLDLSGYTGINT